MRAADPLYIFSFKGSCHSICCHFRAFWSPKPALRALRQVSTMLTDPEMRATCAVYIDELCSDMTVVHLPPSVRRAAAGFSL